MRKTANINHFQLQPYNYFPMGFCFLTKLLGQKMQNTNLIKSKAEQMRRKPLTTTPCMCAYNHTIEWKKQWAKSPTFSRLLVIFRMWLRAECNYTQLSTTSTLIIKYNYMTVITQTAKKKIYEENEKKKGEWIDRLYVTFEKNAWHYSQWTVSLYDYFKTYFQQND